MARGDQVECVEIGALVAIHPVVNCGECVECRRRLTHHCLQFGHLGFDRDGCFAEYIVQRADRVALRFQMKFRHMWARCWSRCASACRRLPGAGNLHGKTVLVVGDGPFGIIIARLALKAADKLIFVGKEEFRLQQVPAANRLQWSSVECTRDEILKRFAATGVDVAILAVSSHEAFDLCLSTLRPRGRLVIFSAGPR